MHRITTFRCAVLLAMLAGGCAFGQARRGQRSMYAALQRPRSLQRESAPVVGGGSQFQARRPAPIERRPPPGQGANPSRNGEHLAQWMNQHRDLSPAQQQQALENEPGFHELRPTAQRRIRDRLAQLNAMPPQQRERWMAHTEAMERLTLDQRAQVRSVMRQLGLLPPYQRQFVARTFRQLRELPPEQRMAVMNSGQYQSQMNDAQRSTLNNLMRIEPMLPPDEKPNR